MTTLSLGISQSSRASTERGEWRRPRARILPSVAAILRSYLQDVTNSSFYNPTHLIFSPANRLRRTIMKEPNPRRKVMVMVSWHSRSISTAKGDRIPHLRT